MSAIPRIPSDPGPGHEPSAATAAPHEASGPAVETSHPGSRVRLSAHPGEHASDGVWWPRTSDLMVEVPLLDVAVQGLTRARIGRVCRVAQRLPLRVQTLLGPNIRTVALGLSMAAGSPLWFFLFEIAPLNLLLLWSKRLQRRADLNVVAHLSA